MTHENRVVESLRFCSNSELRMKILVFLAGLALASSALADIHDPPSNDYGPTRKLGRGLSNFFLAPAEIVVTVATVNTNNSARRRGINTSSYSAISF